MARGWLRASVLGAILAAMVVAACSGTSSLAQPRMAASCHPKVTLETCSAADVESAIDVEQLAARARVGAEVVVRGQALLGGVCCTCSYCTAVVALGSGASGDVTTAVGPLALLTDRWLAETGGAFTRQFGRGFPRECGWDEAGGYCCNSDTMGKQVVVWATVVEPPHVHTGPIGSWPCDETSSISMASRNPTCDYALPWRAERPSVSALAVVRACKVVE
jgi:hypothetical protein